MSHCYAIHVNGRQVTLRTSLPAAKRFANRHIHSFTNVTIIDLDRAVEYVPLRPPARPDDIEWFRAGAPSLATAFCLAGLDRAGGDFGATAHAWP